MNVGYKANHLGMFQPIWGSCWAKRSTEPQFVRSEIIRLEYSYARISCQPFTPRFLCGAFKNLHCGITLTAFQPAGKIALPPQRSCAAIGCTSPLPPNYPHLRCPSCRANNIPRAPGLEKILTPSQIVQCERLEMAQPEPPPPPEPVRKTEPDIDVDLALEALFQAQQKESNGDAEFGDLSYPDEELELTYPEPEPQAPAPSVPSVAEQVKPPVSLAPPPLPTRKRQKITHERPPAPSVPTCSEHGCTNPLKSISTAKRCMSCIAKDWKAKRAQVASLVEKRKAVSWADDSGIGQSSHTDSVEEEENDLPDEEESGEESDETAMAPPTPEPSTPTGLKIRIPRRPANTTRSDTTPSNDSPSESVLSPLGTAHSGPVASDDDLSSVSVPPSSDTTDSIPMVSDDDSLPEITSSPTLVDNTSPPPTDICDSATPTTPVKLKLLIPKPTASASSSSEPDTPQPENEGSRPCANPKCGQRVSADYRWKTCLVCPGNAKSYQRTRQNLQGRHAKLDEELDDHLEQVKDTEEANTSPPASKVRGRAQVSAIRLG